MVGLPKIKRSWSPEERARRTLLRYLSPEQKECFKKHGYFDVEAKDGETYRIHTAAAAKKALWNSKYIQTYSRRAWAEHYRLHRLTHNKPRPWGHSGQYAWPVFSPKEKKTAYEYYNEGTKGVIPEADILLGLKLMLETRPEKATVGCAIPLGDY